MHPNKKMKLREPLKPSPGEGERTYSTRGGHYFPRSPHGGVDGDVVLSDESESLPCVQVEKNGDCNCGGWEFSHDGRPTSSFQVVLRTESTREGKGER